ncbi:MAG: hypothetical protein AAF975_07125, partial [Spirochaetota bacterium]
EVTSTGSKWSARSRHQVVSAASKIWIMGGKAISNNGITLQANNEVWTSTDGVSWTQESDADWSARDWHQAVIYDDKIWVIGGGDYLSDVWAYGLAP